MAVVQLPSVKTTINQNGFAGEKLAMWMHAHRHQAYMFSKLASRMEKLDAGSAESAKELTQAWTFMQQNLVGHSKVEDDLMFPWLEKNVPESKGALHKLDDHHKKLHKLVEDMAQGVTPLASLATEGKTAEVETAKAKLLPVVKEMQSLYAEHSLEEEEKLLPLFQKASKPDMEAFSNTLKEDHKKNSAKWELLGMRDVALSNPESAHEWNSRLPWVLRNVVMPLFIANDHEYKEYLKVYGTPGN